MTLRWRWALVLGGATALISLIALVSLSALTVQELRASVDEDLRQRLELARVDPPGGGARLPFEGLRRRAPVNLDALYQVLGPDGEPLIESEPRLPVTDATLAVVAGPPPAPVLETVEVGGERHRMIVGRLPGRIAAPVTVQIAVPITLVDSSVRALIGRSILVGIGLVLVAGAVGWLLASRTVAPIEELTEEVERIERTRDLWTSTSSDRTDEIGRLARSFGAMVASLRISRDRQQRLISDAGHELRTPLTALRTNLETLERRRSELSDEQMETLLAAALSETLELADLAAELTELARDAESSTEEPSTVRLGDLVELVARRFANRTDQRIEVRGTGDRVTVRVAQIERAITNILSNAVTWNDPGHPIEIEIDGARVSVRDHGPGIAEQDLPHVFERFHRGSDARALPGSGLGLSIVEHVVEGHGGRAFAGNHPEGGAVVGFDLSHAKEGGRV